VVVSRYTSVFVPGITCSVGGVGNQPMSPVPSLLFVCSSNVSNASTVPSPQQFPRHVAATEVTFSSVLSSKAKRLAGKNVSRVNYSVSSGT